MELKSLFLWVWPCSGGFGGVVYKNTVDEAGGKENKKALTSSEHVDKCFYFVAFTLNLQCLCACSVCSWFSFWKVYLDLVYEFWKLSVRIYI